LAGRGGDLISLNFSLQSDANAPSERIREGIASTRIDALALELTGFGGSFGERPRQQSTLCKRLRRPEVSVGSFLRRFPSPGVG
jgi:hypothetical protein